MAKTLTLEESFSSLDKIIDEMENGKPSLEESFKLYNEGLKLIKGCNTQLDKIEKQIVVLDTEEEEEQHE